MQSGRGLCWGVAVSLVGATCFAGDRSADNIRTADQATALVRQLGDPSVRVRDRASEALLKLGRSAKSALLVGSRDNDPEIRTRCRQLLPTALWLDLQARIEAYLADTASKEPHDLPGLARFQQIAGTSPAARALFGDILRADPTLVEQIETDPKAASARFAARAQSLQRQQLMRLGGSQRSTLGKADVACLLFVGSHPNMSLQPAAIYPVYALLNQVPAVRSAIVTAGPNDPFKKLLLAWIGQHTDPASVNQALTLAMNLNLKECLGLALRTMRDKASPAWNRAYAVITVGKLGGKERMKDVEALLSDATVVGNLIFNNVQGTTELRDVALAVCVHVTGQKPMDYGFEILGSNPSMLFMSPYYCGFSAPAKRDAAFKKWQAWKAGKKSATGPAAPPPPTQPIKSPTPRVPRRSPPQ